jgi:Tfp pilus assembly protein PilO
VIVSRKPLVLYDVDVLGLAGTLLLVMAAWWCVARPWRDTWQRYRTLAARHTTVRKALQADVQEMQRFSAELTDTRGAVAAQVARAPRASALSQLLQEMADTAKEAQLELLTVTPQPAGKENEYTITDIQVVGRGRSAEFMRFLDRFAQRNPYQSLQQCAISRPPSTTQPACELSWSVRLYMLPNEPATTPEPRPAGVRS